MDTLDTELMFLQLKERVDRIDKYTKELGEKVLELMKLYTKLSEYNSRSLIELNKRIVLLEKKMED